MPRTNIVTKAARLLEEGKVRILPGAVSVCVEGDTETYTVTVYESGRSWCPCQATSECSHKLAAELLVKASR
jgi:hypothetical protein